MKPWLGNFPRLRPLYALVLAMGFSAGTSSVLADQKTLTLAGAALILDDATTDAGVFFTSMRFNRAARVWNVEVSLTNRSTRAWQGPFVLLVESSSGTSGPLQPDGLDEISKPFYDSSGLVADGELAPQETSLKRTLSLGFQTNASPQLTVKVFARAPQSVAGLSVVRTLDDSGLPLPSVRVDSAGTSAIEAASQTDDAFGLATLTQTNQTRTLRFSAADYQPVWRIVNVSTNGVGMIPSPRLTRRGTNGATLTPIGGGELARGTPPVRVRFTPGAFSQDTAVLLTPLTGQTLPLLLPQGWSPLSAFWLELTQEPALPGSGELTPWAPIAPGETAAFVRLSTNALIWEALQLVGGNGSNAVNIAVPGSGAYALVAPDTTPIAPPNPIVGAPLPPSTTPLPDPANLRANGTVTPSSSPASKVPELVTATAEVIVTNLAGNLPSGALLRGEVSERYTLRDGTRRFPALFDNFVVGYQRPGDAQLDTLRVEFPIRPLLLFGAEELQEAVVHIELFAPAAFSGSVLGTNGGQVSSEGLRVLAGLGDLLASQAVQLQRLEVANFTELVGGNATVVAAFELGVNGVAAGRRLILQFGGLTTNAIFVLARVLAREGLYGLEPCERLHSDAGGNLQSDEPASGENLPGLNGAGQYVLLRIDPAQGLLSGIAKNSSGQPAGGLPLRITGQLWLTFSANNGAFKLLAPAGDATVTVTDLVSGDSGAQIVEVPNPQAAVNTQLASVSSGPRVLSVTPTNNATGVSRVSPIVVTFSEPVNPGTLVSVGIQLLGTTGTPVAARLMLNLRNTVATLLPTEQLAPSTLHTILISTNVGDLTGLQLEGLSSFTFTTESDLLNRPAADLVMYEPTNGLARMTGGPGLAEPNGAVILVNERSGATATVLAKPDGSFDNFIEADVEDELSAVIMNANGTRNKVRVSKQLFSDGSVGLFNQGGTVEAAGEGGIFELIIPGGIVKTKLIVKIEPMILQEVINSLPNPPEEAQVIAGMQISMKSSDVEGNTEISIPIDPARIQLPDNAPPEDGAYALAMVRELEGGGVAYQIVDKLRYENGRLHSNTAPHKGWGEAFTDAIANNPLGVIGMIVDPVSSAISATVTVLLLGTRPITVTGRVGVCPGDAQGGCIDAALDPFFQLLDHVTPFLLSGVADQLVQTTRRPLPGAFISLALPQTTSGRQGRLHTGIVYATSDRRGVYALVLPFANGGFVLTATHPRFADVQSEPLRPFVDYELGAGALRRNFIFALPVTADAAARVDVFHAPLFPATNQQATITVDAIHPSTSPTIILTVDGVGPAANGSISDVRITEQVDSSPGPNQKRKTAKVSCAKELTARIKVRAITVGQNQGIDATAVAFHNISFGLVPPGVTNLAIMSDPEDKVGPQIERTEPLAGGVLQAGQPLVLIFSEPIDAGVKSQSSQFTLDNSTPGTPSLVLSSDQTRLEIRFAGLKADHEYQLTVAATIQDIAGNRMILPATVSGVSFKLKFRTLPVSTANLRGVDQGGGVTVHGNYAYVLDRSGNGNLRVYDISNPTQPHRVSETVTFIGDPRDLVILPAWPHVRTKTGAPQTNDFLAVVGGNLGTSSLTGNPGKSFQEVNVFFQGQFLRVFDISDPANPVRVVGGLLTLRPDAVTKIRWDPPHLAFLEIGSDFQRVGLIDLQEMLIGFNATPAEVDRFPLFGIKGIDGIDEGHPPDGDYVDPGERVPTPPHQPNEFFGLKRSFLPGLNFGARLWTDFDYKTRGDYCGVTFREGKELDQLGKPTGIKLKPGYRTLAFGDDLDSPSATLTFDFGAVPKRVFSLLSLNVGTDNALDIRNLALVSLSPDADGVSKLAVIDISQPNAPVLTNKIVLPPQFNLGFAQSVRRRPDHVLALATTLDLLLLDERKLLIQPSPGGAPHPAIVGVVPGAGSGNISLGRNDAGSTRWRWAGAINWFRKRRNCNSSACYGG